MTTESQPPENQAAARERLDEIGRRQRERQVAAARDGDEWCIGDDVLDEIDYLLSLLQQPATSERCVDRPEHDWYNDGDMLRCYDCTATQSATSPAPVVEGEPSGSCLACEAPTNDPYCGECTEH
jgi:hypothetical protein